MKLSISNSVFSNLPLEKNLATIKSLGFSNIEFNMKTVEKENDVSIHPVTRIVADSGLSCLSVHSATLHVEDVVEIHRAVYYAKISLDFAEKLGAQIMVVHSDASRKLDPRLRRKVLGQIFSELMPYAKKLGITIALENLSYASSGYGKNVAEFEEIFDLTDNNDLGFTLDFCHSTASGTTLSLLENYHSRLCNIHMSNRSHKPFIKETAGLKMLIERLGQFGYKGLITLELSRKCAISEISQTKAVVESVMSTLV